MTPFNAINLEQLPPPEVVEQLSFEQILSELVEEYQDRYPEFDAILESEPVIKLLEVVAYRETVLRARVNDAAHAVMLAFAKRGDLDQIAARFRVQREVLNPGDPDALPPVPPTLEDDERLRQRVQLSFEGFSTAGPVGAYIFHTLAADPRIVDVDVRSPDPGNVLVTLLTNQGQGIPSEDVIEATLLHLNSENIRPLTDRVLVATPEIRTYSVEARLFLYDEPDAEIVRQAAENAVIAYTQDRHKLGRDITLSGLYAALHQPGVQRVELITPADDILIGDNQAPFNESIAVTVGVE